MSDTRAAAERLRRAALTVLDKPVIANKYDAAAYELARAYIAEHPANDGEAVDEAWLLAIGGSKGWHPDKITFDRNDALSVGLWNVSDGWKAMLLLAEHSAVCIVRGLRTRGNVRRLCAALGVELKEAT